MAPSGARFVIGICALAQIESVGPTIPMTDALAA
jgi:hypothetical protein